MVYQKNKISLPYKLFIGQQLFYHRYLPYKYRVIFIYRYLSYKYRMVRRMLMAKVGEGRVRGRQRLGWMDGVKVT